MKQVLWGVLAVTAGCIGALNGENDARTGADASHQDVTGGDAGRDAPMESREDAGSDVAVPSAPTATCATIGEFVVGSETCRDEPVRCTLSHDSTSTCGEACNEMGLGCLRAYPEAEGCFPAVELGQMACDEAPADRALCQCGDPTAEYEPWVVVTIGDSTMSNRGQPGDESGWGDELPMFGVRPGDVHNDGSSGASSLDFETRSNWPRAHARLGPNVFLLIQFGHNDGSDDPNRHTEPGSPPDYLGSYRDRLAFYVAEARKAGATPLIATSMGHMLFNEDGTSRDTRTTDYVRSARQYAADEGLPLIDGNIGSRREFERVGPDATIERYSFDEVTHFSPEGARRMAEIMVHLACVESEVLCAQFTIR